MAVACASISDSLIPPWKELQLLQPIGGRSSCHGTRSGAAEEEPAPSAPAEAVPWTAPAHSAAAASVPKSLAVVLDRRIIGYRLPTGVDLVVYTATSYTEANARSTNHPMDECIGQGISQLILR